MNALLFRLRVALWAFRNFRALDEVRLALEVNQTMPGQERRTFCWFYSRRFCGFPKTEGTR